MSFFMAIDQVMTVTRKTLYIASVVGILALTASLAIIFGYISPDSWYYIFLAQSLRAGHGFSLHHEYMAIYPCGYPTILALTAPVTSLAGFMVSSKLTNLALLTASFFCVFKASKHILMATLVVINPLTLLIGMFTWSENLVMFCFCGILYALSQLHLDMRKPWPYVLLGMCLIIGCFTRYFFGPFAFILFLCAWLAYGRAIALRIFPLFCVAGVLFLAYQKFNLDATGYTTGMPRVPAPEHVLLLIRQFCIAFGTGALAVIAAAVVLIGPSYRKIRLAGEANPASLFVIAAGLGFLALAFALRLHALFDPFGTRTIGYGIVFLTAGLVGRYVHFKVSDTYPVAPLVACGLLCALFADGPAIPQSLDDLVHGSYSFPAASIQTLRGPKPAQVVVSFDVPIPVMDSGDVDNISEIYYGPDTTVISPQSGPDDQPETPANFLKRLGDVRHKSCVFDFTPYATLGDFNAYLNSTTLVDHRFWQTPPTLEKANFDPGMKAWLQHAFRPGVRVPCGEILSQ